MDRALNPKLEKETIYEIYRGCRLCGAGAGYKMPIIQNVLDTEDSELNLPQKIRECVQIEVHADDKMPPLICELCVDKVNDFYEFLVLCRQTNKRTRLKLGLPLQNAPKEVQESTDCILGDTEPVYINSDSDIEPLSQHKRKPKSKEKSKTPKSTMKKELEYNINIENILTTDRSSRSCRVKRKSPTPPRNTRISSGASEKRRSPTPPPRITRTNISSENTKTQDTSKKSKLTPIVRKEVKSIMKKGKEDEKSQGKPLSSLKRAREKDVKIEVPQKKVKLVIEPSTPKPKSKPVKPKPPASDASDVKQICPVCSQGMRTTVGYHNHMRSHVVSFTNTRLACNACGEWFSSLTEAAAHHGGHARAPYKCRRCTAEYTTPEAYDNHFGKKQCVPFDEVPDVRCEECWRYFATDKLLIEHKCAGEDGRPGGKCPKCNRTYVLLKNLIRHESTCLHRRRSEYNADPETMKQLRPVQIRVARCDPLLKNMINDHYDVHNVVNFGLDENCEYPYLRNIPIKTEPFEGMVKINEEIEKEFLSKDVWDSENSDTEADKLQSLRNLALNKVVAMKEKEEIPKDVTDINSEVLSEVNVKNNDKSTLSVNNDLSLKENSPEESTEDSRTGETKESSIKEDDSQNAENSERDEKMDAISASEIDTHSNGIDKENSQDSLIEKFNDIRNGAKNMENGVEKKLSDVENGTDAFNNTDDSEFDSEIDGDKLMAALNAQIGEDDEETQNGEKDDTKHNLDDEKQNVDDKHQFDEKTKSLDKKSEKLSLEELLSKDKSMDLDNISDEDFNFDV